MAYLFSFRPLSSITASLLAPLALVGCGGSDDGAADQGQNQDQSATFETYAGTYEITSYLASTDSCDASESVLEDFTEPYMIAYTQNFFGGTLTFLSCSDLENCAEKQSAIDNEDLVGGQQLITFTSADGDDELSGDVASAGSSGSDDLCERTYSELRLTRSGSSLSIIVEERRLEDAPEDAGGFCTADLLKYRSEAEDAACSGAEALELIRVD